MKLFNAGFRMYSYKEFFPKGQKIGTVKVGKGSQDTVNIVTQESIGLTVLKGNEENYKTQILLPKTISAPFSQGTPAGEIIIYRDDEKIESFTPVTEVSVKKGSVFRMISKVLKGVYTL
jgi:D-alanyl-D-alanine carboxypeptidase (penicillin-binding protein 5/6)